MFYRHRTTVPDDPETVRAEYESELAAIVSRTGVDEAAAATDVDRSILEAVAAGNAPEMTLEDAAAIQALSEQEPDADEIVQLACEHLLLGMSTAIVDVETLQDELSLALDAKEIQQKIERRAPMTFEEFAHLQYAIVSRM